MRDMYMVFIMVFVKVFFKVVVGVLGDRHLREVAQATVAETALSWRPKK
jgi:hypothetical protein